jgi:L-2-hydroxycarboxylate dehydrogenase (NAD+)
LKKKNIHEKENREIDQKIPSGAPNLFIDSIGSKSFTKNKNADIMKIQLDELKDLCMKVMRKSGLDEKTCELVLEEYLDGELRNSDSHGIAMIKKFGTGTSPNLPKWEIEKDEETYMLVNGNQNYGQLILSDILPKLIEKTKKNKITMFGMYNAKSYSRPGTYARKVAESDLIGIIMNYSGKNRVAPFGGIDPMLGTNPIGIGIPGDPNIVLDIATSKRNFAMVRVAQRLGKQIPEDLAVDKDGNPSTNPDKIMDGALYPFGGYKGYGLGLTIEVLTRLMFNLKEVPCRGFFFILVDPTAFGDLETFKQNVIDLENEIKNSRSAPRQEIRIPGERGDKLKAEALERGWIEIDDKIIEELKGLL